jgi:hypothetical protein
MKLWVDDIRPAPEEYDTAVATAKEAIDLLSTGTVTHISLDHDLGLPSAGTGYDIARWIETAAFEGKIPQLVWRIHSANPVGRVNMHVALSNADKYFTKGD